MPKQAAVRLHSVNVRRRISHVQVLPLLGHDVAPHRANIYVRSVVKPFLTVF